jgi:hypothetical protein
MLVGGYPVTAGMSDGSGGADLGASVEKAPRVSVQVLTLAPLSLGYAVGNVNP